MSTTWTSGGVEWEVSTDCSNYDTEAACAAAHSAAVEHWQGIAPPDPE